MEKSNFLVYFCLLAFDVINSMYSKQPPVEKPKVLLRLLKHRFLKKKKDRPLLMQNYHFLLNMDLLVHEIMKPTSKIT
jgi:hypothetical protein